jgi:hypothetical protein
MSIQRHGPQRPDPHSSCPLLPALVVMILAALWAGAVWLRAQSVEVPTYNVDPRDADSR